MKRVLNMQVMLLISILALAGQAAQAKTQTVKMQDGRYYRIDLPANSKSAPMILALHGGGGNPDQTARNSGLTKPALAAGYAVVYPAGTARRDRLLTWNGGYCCAYAAQSGVDDVAFLDRVIADAARRFGLDGRRVYMTGMSNGAIMAQRYASERPGNVRAIASVSGTIDPQIRLRGAVPMLHIHGTNDESVPYNGGQGTGVTRTDFNSVAATVGAFRTATRATRGPDRRVIDPADDGFRVIQDDWRDRQGRVMVRLLTVEGGGHVWPGGRRSGRTDGTRDISANTELLRFFAQHP